METFLSIHQQVILGEITMFDRMIFRGHLSSFYPEGAFQRFLAKQNIMLKHFGRYVQTMTGILKEHAQGIAKESDRSFIYLDSPTTKAKGKSKEDLARQIAQEEGITEGLICVFSVLELCMSFQVKPNHETHKLHAVRAPRKCLHFYFYLIDPEFGFMHIRVQSWFPFQIQIYINGREWLARQMDKKRVQYRRYENCFLWVDRLQEAQRLCQSFIRRKWERVLNAFARRVNPLLPMIKQAGFGGYWWVLDQGEIATDIMFRSRSVLTELLSDVVGYAVGTFSCEDVMRFLGRKLHGNFLGEVITDLKKRPEGYRVKHRVKGNSIKIYDKWSVLRIETTISHPREFKVLRVIIRPKKKHLRQWRPMGKGVANIWRYFQVGRQSNRRYLEALAQVTLRGKAVKELDSLCQPVVRDGKRHAKLYPLSPKERAVFRAVVSTDHVIHGVRNKDVRQALYGSSAGGPQEERRRCARVPRMLSKLRGHGLIYRVRNAHLYRVTRRGYRVMSSILAFHRTEFAEAYALAS